MSGMWRQQEDVPTTSGARIGCRRKIALEQIRCEAKGIVNIKGIEVVEMVKEHIPAGSLVDPGLYRCNACANQYECTMEGEALPMCPVCDSVSWRTQQIARDMSGKKYEQK